MNREDVIRMSRESGGIDVTTTYIPDGMTVWLGTGTPEFLERFAALVAAHEREACCKIVYGLCESDNSAQRTVEAIRARGQENKS
jgi:hypothetical protein